MSQRQNLKIRNLQILEGVSTQLQSSGLVAHENSTFRNLALAFLGPLWRKWVLYSTLNVHVIQHCLCLSG